MRFTRLQTPAFGVLRDLDTGDDPLGGLVIVEGRNEAGKSTFFELLCVLLYGFYPAARDTYPYTPWGGGVAEAEGRVNLESGGEPVIVQRRLLSSPRGAIRQGPREEELRNRTVPWVQHVPRTVFKQVFALTLSELAALDGQGWSTVQDRLLGAMGASDLRPARKVTEELQEEAGGLWRPTRRGRPAVRELRERIRELRLRRHEALEEDRRIRQVSADRDVAVDELEILREERERARVLLERIQTLLPVRRRLIRIAELETRAASSDEQLEDLPLDVAEHRTRLRSRYEELGRRIREIEEDREDPCAAVEAFGPDDERLLARRREIEDRESEWAGAEPARAREALLVREIQDRQRRIQTNVTAILDRDLDEALRGAIAAFPTRPLHRALDDAQRARRALESLGEPEEHEPVGSGRAPWPGGALVVLGSILLVAGWAWGRGTPLVAGGICLAAGIALTSVWWTRRSLESRGRDEVVRRQEERARCRRSLDAAEEQVVSLLRPLSPGPDAPPPTLELPMRLERIQESIREEDDRREELGQVEARIGAAVRGLRGLGELLPEGDPPSEPGALAHLLDRALQRAASRKAEAEAATRELARLGRALESAREEEARLGSELEALDRQLARLGGGDVSAGLEEAVARRSAAARAAQLREELERDHPDLETVRQRIREAENDGEDWTVDPDARASIRARLQELEERIESRTRRVEALEKDLEFLGNRTRLDEIDGEILELEERAEGLSRRRDRLWVMARIVQEAERTIREEHQPAVLQEASSILSGLTSGRYDRIVLTGRDGRDFRIRGPATRDSLPVASPLSTGTREQVYLALRLAILDQLDRSGERLPLFLDEVLVNWDPERREAGLTLLAERSRKRQCFFFTCHPGLAERLEALGGRRIRLPAPVGRNRP